MSIVAADIGGTRTRVARIDGGGRITARREVPTAPGRGASVALRELGGLIDALAADAPDRLRGIGLSITGPVDTATGVVDNPYTLPGWGAVDVVSPMRDRFDVPVGLLNDADAAAIGECAYGAGRGAQRLVVITIGTGIGMGVVVDGVLQRRADGAHAEAGHHLIDPGGPTCSCGGHGCWEAVASGQALVRLAQERGFRVPDDITDPDERTRRFASAVAAGAESAEPKALAILHEIAWWIGVGLVNTAAFLAPDVIVIGGGLGVRFFDLMAPTTQEVLRRNHGMVRTDADLRVALNGDDAGLFGAGRWMARTLDGEPLCRTPP
jgi:glucokinase